MNASTPSPSVLAPQDEGMSDQALGFVFVLIAITIFGSWGLPLKVKAVAKTNIDKVVFQSYSCFVVSTLGFFVLIWNDFVFSWWGLPGAVLWVISNTTGMVAVSMIGVATAIPVIAGTTIVMSFLAGVAVFGEVPSSLGLSIVGIGGIILGVIGVSQAQSVLPNKLAKLLRMEHCIVSEDSAAADGGTDEHEGRQQVPTSEALELTGSTDFDDDEHLVDNKSGDGSNAAAATAGEKKSNVGMGILIALVTGILNGMLMVPVTYFAQELELMKQVALAEDPNAVLPVTSELSYLVPFSIGILIIDPLFVLTYHVAVRRWPEYHFRVTALPGLACGLLWFSGNCFAIYATAYLGNTVGYPLTQTNLLIAACWGIVFREIRGMGVVVIIASALVLLAGSGLLAVFGSGGALVVEPPPL